jgi:hypothetical protein
MIHLTANASVSRMPADDVPCPPICTESERVHARLGGLRRFGARGRCARCANKSHAAHGDPKTEILLRFRRLSSSACFPRTRVRARVCMCVLLVVMRMLQSVRTTAVWCGSLLCARRCHRPQVHANG